MIDEAIKYIERLINRELTGEELFIVTVAYQQGTIEALYAKGNNSPDKNEKE